MWVIEWYRPYGDGWQKRAKMVRDAEGAGFHAEPFGADDLDFAIREAVFARDTLTINTYRIRNTETGDIIMADIL